MELVFLKAKQKLVKEITKEGTRPYPLVKNFTSEHYTIELNQEGFDKFYELLNTHAAAGHASTTKPRPLRGPQQSGCSRPRGWRCGRAAANGSGGRSTTRRA